MIIYLNRKANFYTSTHYYEITEYRTNTQQDKCEPSCAHYFLFFYLLYLGKENF